MSIKQFSGAANSPQKYFKLKIKKKKKDENCQKFLIEKF